MNTISPPPDAFVCRYCGQVHTPVELRRREQASCVRCASPLAKAPRWGTDEGVALMLTAAILAVPAFTSPFMVVSKIGRSNTELAGSGSLALWDHGMVLLSSWVMWTMLLAPCLLLLAATLIILSRHFGQRPRALESLQIVVRVMRRWSMPEVYVLSVLVALIRLGAVVDVRLGVGFYCYTAMAAATLLAWRSFDFNPMAQTIAKSPDPEARG